VVFEGGEAGEIPRHWAPTGVRRPLHGRCCDTAKTVSPPPPVRTTNTTLVATTLEVTFRPYRTAIKKYPKRRYSVALLIHWVDSSGVSEIYYALRTQYLTPLELFSFLNSPSIVRNSPSHKVLTLISQVLSL
jgi:hypothetical protein